MVKRLIMAVTLPLALILSLCLVTSVPAMADEDAAQPVVIPILSGATILGAPGEQGVSGQGWDVDDEIDLYINGEYVATAIAEPNAEGNASPGFDTTNWGVMKPKDKVKLVRSEDGLTTDVVIASFVILGANLEDNTVYGLAEPSANITVFVRMDNQSDTCFRFEVADANGFWLADFSEPTDNPGTMLTCDLADVWFCSVAQSDNEYDMSAIVFDPEVTSQPILTLAEPDLLAKSYRGLKVAADALGFNSVKELQEDIRLGRGATVAASRKFL